MATADKTARSQKQKSHANSTTEEAWTQTKPMTAANETTPAEVVSIPIADPAPQPSITETLPAPERPQVQMTNAYQLAQHYLDLAKQQTGAIKEEVKEHLDNAVAGIKGLNVLGEDNVLADERFKESVRFLKLQFGEQSTPPQTPAAASSPSRAKGVAELAEAAKKFTGPFSAGEVAKAANVENVSYAIKKLVESGAWKKTGEGKGAKYTSA